MSYLANLKASGSLTAKAPWQAKAKSVRAIFIKAVNANIEKITKGEKKSQWFELKGDGSYLITPRVGTNIMQFEGSRVQIAAKDKAEALTVMKGFIEATQAGEFDDQLNEVRSKRQQSKSMN